MKKSCAESFGPRACVAADTGAVAIHEAGLLAIPHASVAATPGLIVLSLAHGVGV